MGNILKLYIADLPLFETRSDFEIDWQCSVK
jgi:hypothetical protein